MFTGLIESLGTVRRVDRTGAGARLVIGSPWEGAERPAQGDSIAVNGACLTAIDPEDHAFSADLSPETVRRTLLGRLRSGDSVNLERALRLGDRLGGHLVQGHVDTVIKLISVTPEGDFSRWRFSLPREAAPDVALKGSVAVHGVSLTVSALGGSWFEVALIPETLRSTNLGELRPGAALHLETDVLAKYVGRRLGGAPSPSVEEIFGSGGSDA
jgi:riboflavin synthase